MKITQDTVYKIAKLAQLKIESDQIDAYMKDLNKVLDLFEQMQGINTEDVEPLFHAKATKQHLREDVAYSIDRKSYYQQNAPQVASDFYLVPSALESSE